MSHVSTTVITDLKIIKNNLYRAVDKDDAASLKVNVDTMNSMMAHTDELLPDLYQLCIKFNKDKCRAYLETLDINYFSYEKSIQLAADQGTYHAIGLMQNSGDPDFPKALRRAFMSMMRADTDYSSFFMKVASFLHTETLAELLTCKTLFEPTERTVLWERFLNMNDNTPAFEEGGLPLFNAFYNALFSLEKKKLPIPALLFTYNLGLMHNAETKKLNKLFYHLLTHAPKVSPTTLLKLYKQYTNPPVAVLTHMYRSAGLFIQKGWFCGKDEMLSFVKIILNNEMTGCEPKEFTDEYKEALTPLLTAITKTSSDAITKVARLCIDFFQHPLSPYILEKILTLIEEHYPNEVSMSTPHGISAKVIEENMKILEMIAVDYDFEELLEHDLPKMANGLLSLWGGYKRRTLLSEPNEDSRIRFCADKLTSKDGFPHCVALSLLIDMPIEEVFDPRIEHNAYSICYLSKRFTLSEMLPMAKTDATKNHILNALT